MSGKEINIPAGDYAVSVKIHRRFGGSDRNDDILRNISYRSSDNDSAFAQTGYADAVCIGKRLQRYCVSIGGCPCDVLVCGICGENGSRDVGALIDRYGYLFRAYFY